MANPVTATSWRMPVTRCPFFLLISASVCYGHISSLPFGFGWMIWLFVNKPNPAAAPVHPAQNGVPNRQQPTEDLGQSSGVEAFKAFGNEWNRIKTTIGGPQDCQDEWNLHKAERLARLVKPRIREWQIRDTPDEWQLVCAILILGEPGAEWQKKTMASSARLTFLGISDAAREGPPEAGEREKQLNITKRFCKKTL